MSGKGLRQDQGPLGATRAFPPLPGRFLGAVRLRRCLFLRGRGNLREARDQLDPAQQAALGGMPDPVVPHLVRATREDVLQESPDELHDAERHRLPLPLATDLVAERHPTVFDAKACFPGVLWQRCQFHLQQNALHYVRKVAMRKEVAADLRTIFDAPDRHEADRRIRLEMKKYAKTAPKLTTWIEANVPEGLAVMDLPASQHRRLRTSNMLEHLSQEIKRRTRVATLFFPNEASLLRLVSAVLIEISEEWEIGKVYLRIQDGPPTWAGESVQILGEN